MGEFIAGHITICSIYPLKVGPVSRPYHKARTGGMTTFEIEAVPHGEFRTLPVYDCWQAERNYFEPSNSASHKVLTPIFANDIAADLVNCWTNGILTTANSAGRPGVAIIAEDQPNRAELASLKSTQSDFLTSLFNDGQRLAQAKDWRNITGLHRLAAKWLGKADNSEGGWATGINPEEFEDCPACGSRVKAGVSICAACRTMIRPLSPELQRLNQMATPVGGNEPPVSFPLVPPVKPTPQHPATK